MSVKAQTLSCDYVFIEPDPSDSTRTPRRIHFLCLSVSLCLCLSLSLSLSLFSVKHAIDMGAFVTVIPFASQTDRLGWLIIRHLPSLSLCLLLSLAPYLSSSSFLSVALSLSFCRSLSHLSYISCVCSTAVSFWSHWEFLGMRARECSLRLAADQYRHYLPSLHLLSNYRYAVLPQLPEKVIWLLTTSYSLK